MRKRLEIFAQNVKIALEEQQRRPAWLAEMSGVKAPNLSKLLKGEGNPTFETLQAIADALDADLDELLKPSSESPDSHHWFDIAQLRDEKELLQSKRNKLGAIIQQSLIADELKNALESRDLIEERLDHVRKRIEFLEIENINKDLGVRPSKKGDQVTSEHTSAQTVAPDEIARLQAFENKIRDIGGADLLEMLQDFHRPRASRLRTALGLPELPPLHEPKQRPQASTATHGASQQSPQAKKPTGKLG